MAKTRSLFIVPHTHWDREWYNPLEVFNVHLVEMQDGLLDHFESGGRFPCFMLDGQSILARDYLRVRPFHRESFGRYAREGRIQTGPWFVNPDLFLSGGEALIRNLLWGRRYASLWGEPQPVLYVPESGGLISQIPQIMKGFGMEHLVFIRGIGNEALSSEYLLEGADGTKVVATYLQKAYNNGGFLPENLEEAQKRIQRETMALENDTISSWLLLNNGGDHLPPQYFLLNLTEVLEKSGEYRRVKVGSYRDYYETIMKEIDRNQLPHLKGEIAGAREYPVLPGRNTARMDFKLNLSHVQNRLIHQTEPIGAVLSMWGRPVPDALLDRCWELLLENHHHNTLGGTVIDAVFREASLRLEKIRQLMDEEWKNTVSFIQNQGKRSETPEAVSAVVINPLPRKRTGPVLLRGAFPGDAGARLKVTDDRGNPVPCQHVPGKRGGSHEDRTILITASNVPGLGCRTYRVTSDPTPDVTCELSPVISNEFLQVGFEPGGTFFVKDLEEGFSFEGLNRFIDEADAGDSYNFSPVPGDMTLTNILRDPVMELVETGSVRQTLRLSGNLSLPRGLDAGGKGRDRRFVDSPATLLVSLYQGIPLVECILSLKNQSRDHRLGISFPLNLAVSRILAGQPFDLVNRELDTPSGDGWIESPRDRDPFEGLLLVGNDSRGMAIISHSLREYAVERTSPGCILRTTLFRSVGWLCRRGLVTRRVAVAPTLQTEGAQCQEEMLFKYYLAPTGSHRELPRVLELFQQCQGPMSGAVLPPGMEPGPVPGGLNLSPSSLVVSGIIPRRDGSVVMRFYNPTDEAVKGIIEPEPHCPLSHWNIGDMAGEGSSEINLLPAEFSVPPRGIITLKLFSEKPLEKGISPEN